MAFKMNKFSGFKQTDDFDKIAKSRASQNKIIQKDLESKGYTFSDSEKSASRGNLNKPKGNANPPQTKSTTTTRPRGKSYAKAKSLNLTKNAKKKIAKKVIKKVGSKLIPGLGTIALGADIVKEIKSGGAGIKKNIKDVKKFFGKKPTAKLKNIKKDLKKKTYLSKQKNLNYPPQTQRKK